MPPEVLGQVFTPPAVADLALTLALEGARDDATILDPACGDGVFLTRAVARGVDAGHLHGVELDPVAHAAARARVPGANVALGDWFDVPLGRFDVIVGNPPYVRQEELGAARKGALAKIVQRDAGVAMGARADLAIAFTVRATAALAPGGRLAFVLSEAVLDAGYGAALRARLGDDLWLRAIVASPDERWFADAALHAAIVVLERPHVPGPAPATRVCALRVPVAEAATRVRTLTDLDDVARVRLMAAADVLRAAWAPLLRAPEVWARFTEVAGVALRPLGTLATVRRGFTTGANEFFYLRAREPQGIEPACLAPVLRAEKGARAITVDAGRLGTRAFLAPAGRVDALPPGARAWVERHAELRTRSTLASRPTWWSLAAAPARLFLAKAYDARFVQRLASTPVVCDQRLYAIDPRDGIAPELLAAVLNATPTALAIESLGRASMGEGALELAVTDAAELPVIDPRAYDAPARARVKAALAGIATRPIGTVAEEAAAPDRAALDAAVLAPWPTLAALAPELRAALVVAVGRRIARARPS